MNTSLAADFIVQGAEPYKPSVVGDGVVRLDLLNLFVEVVEVQADLIGDMGLFIAEITATSAPKQPGMTITSVGIGEDLKRAVGQSAGQWLTGVLPVLAHWRGQHTCLIGDDANVTTRGGMFDLISGPLIARGREDSPPDPTDPAESVVEVIRPVLQTHSFKPRLHWLELYTCKQGDGSVQATCRLDNRDWEVGQAALAKHAEGFPDTGVPIRSSRQFVLMLPEKGDRQKIVVPSFWSWMLGWG